MLTLAIDRHYICVTINKRFDRAMHECPVYADRDRVEAQRPPSRIIRSDSRAARGDQGGRDHDNCGPASRHRAWIVIDIDGGVLNAFTLSRQKHVSHADLADEAWLVSRSKCWESQSASRISPSRLTAAFQFVSFHPDEHASPSRRCPACRQPPPALLQAVAAVLYRRSARKRFQCSKKPKSVLRDDRYAGRTRRHGGPANDMCASVADNPHSDVGSNLHHWLGC